MYLYEFMIYNREVFKLIYTIVISIICFAIVIKTDRLFRLSFHQGIRYFRNAFFFYGLAFIMRYFLGTVYIFTSRTVLHASAMKVVFEFFLIMAGFSLLYSLLWKKFEPRKESISSLFNARFALFYCIALVVVILDVLWKTYTFMFLLQIVLFGSASIVSYIKSRESKRGSFLRLYFIVIFLNLIAWLANFIVASFLSWHQGGVISIYILNIIIFFLFLYGVTRTTIKNG